MTQATIPLPPGAVVSREWQPEGCRVFDGDNATSGSPPLF